MRRRECRHCGKRVAGTASLQRGIAMEKDKWQVNVWPDCGQRIGYPPNIAQTVLAHLRTHLVGHNAYLWRFSMDYRSQKTECPHWILYCLVEDHFVDVVGAVPRQHSGRGKEWFQVAEQHYKLFCMPWRIKHWERVCHADISAGRRAVEALYKGVLAFIGSLTLDSPIRNGFRKELDKARKFLDDSYWETTHNYLTEQGVLMDRAIHILHTIIDETGEELGFLPLGNSLEPR